ncbi:MAG: phosphopantothenoylcysteine decarboxylase [Limisphaerales bacterium]
MDLLITCGPAWEPLDGMRRLTNASTGRLGAVLADAFAEAGHRVTLFRGDMATAPLPKAEVDVVPFGTNDDLAECLAGWPENSRVDAVFHAAALCDFKAAKVRADDGTELSARKLPTRSGRLTVELDPATKVLPRLREWFPFARIVGWKYELDGGQEQALAAAWRQLKEAATDACVLNGGAWGEGFALCEPPDRIHPCVGAAELTAALLAWLRQEPAVS